MNNVSVTLYVSKESELYFLQILKIVDGLPIENDWSWRVYDICISKNHESKWLAVNIPIDLYLKFKTSYCKNGGTF